MECAAESSARKAGRLSRRGVKAGRRFLPFWALPSIGSSFSLSGKNEIVSRTSSCPGPLRRPGEEGERGETA